MQLFKLVLGANLFFENREICKFHVKEINQITLCETNSIRIRVVSTIPFDYLKKRRRGGLHVKKSFFLNLQHVNINKSHDYKFFLHVGEIIMSPYTMNKYTGI